MKILIAMDSFKGSMTSLQAGAACKAGILKAMDADVVVKPLADGGEGTVTALVEGLNGKYEYAEVTGPMGEKVRARYGILQDKTAVMEMAEAAGITLVKGQLNPWQATSFGVGELILDAVKKGCRNFIIGIGGSATTEGGIGMLSALGYEFYDEAGNKLAPVFESLGRVKKACADKVPEKLKECRFEIACDVTNPLCGENGSIYIFGGQKGVREEEKADMDRQMRHYADCLEAYAGRKISQIPGTGAAGGLGFAFIFGFNNVELKSGINIVLDAVDFEDEMQDADIVVTGEGRLDSQTAMGKVPIGVAKAAKRHGCKVIALAGSVSDDARECNREGIDAFFPIIRSLTSLDEAMKCETAERNMENTAEQVFRLLSCIK